MQRCVDWFPQASQSRRVVMGGGRWYMDRVYPHTSSRACFLTSLGLGSIITILSTWSRIEGSLCSSILWFPEGGLWSWAMPRISDTGKNVDLGWGREYGRTGGVPLESIYLSDLWAPNSQLVTYHLHSLLRPLVLNLSPPFSHPISWIKSQDSENS